MWSFRPDQNWTVETLKCNTAIQQIEGRGDIGFHRLLWIGFRDLSDFKQRCGHGGLLLFQIACWRGMRFPSQRSIGQCWSCTLVKLHKRYYWSLESLQVLWTWKWGRFDFVPCWFVYCAKKRPNYDHMSKPSFKSRRWMEPWCKH